MRNKRGKVWVYKDRKRWRVEITRADGTRVARVYTSKEVAEEVAAAALHEMEHRVQTVQEAIEVYMTELADRGSAPSHLVSARARLSMMFPIEKDWLIGEVHPVIAQRFYDDVRERKSLRTGKRYAVDTHRHALNESRAMCKWLITKGVLAANPFEKVEGVGKRKKGKGQLTIDEARKFVDACLNYQHPEMRGDGRNRMRTPKLDPQIGVTAAMCCLILAMRASEIAGLSPRSIDDGGRVLRVFRDTTKSDAGERLLEVPEILRDRLPALAATTISRYQVNNWVHRICKAAGITDVGPHALRGTHASLATRAGATSQLVAGSLGHASTEVTHRHYTKADAVTDANVGVALTVLAGGKS